jgi:hypothetical protein
MTDAYFDLLDAGPFPEQIDPWAEAGRYFHQLHAGLIAEILRTARAPLQRMGYLIGQETSLQVTDGRLPDIFVERRDDPTRLMEWDYDTAAAEVLAQPGVIVPVGELSALHISEARGALVAVIEIVSPRNKHAPAEIAQYQDRRARLVNHEGVNVVEIDLTRSVKRLLSGPAARGSAYHVAIYLPGSMPRLVAINAGDALPRIAIPLRAAVIPLDLAELYRAAYRTGSIAAQIEGRGDYVAEALPFPSLLTPQMRDLALAGVVAWRDELARLRTTA